MKLELLFPVGLLIALCFAGCSNESSDPVKEAMASGECHMERAEFSQAVSALKLVAERTPDNAKARRLLAEAYVAMQNADEAEVHGKAFLALVPDDPCGLYLLGRAHLLKADRLKQDDPKGSAERLDLARKIAADLSEAEEPYGYLLQARLVLADGDLVAALSYAEKAAGLKAAPAEARLLCGDLYCWEARVKPEVRAERHREARKMYESVVSKYPAYTYAARMRLADLAASKGDKPGSKAALLAILDENPKSLDTLIALADNHLSMEEWDECLAVCRRAQKVTRRAPVSRLVGYAYHGKKEYDKALAPLTKAAEQFPNDFNVHLTLAHVLVELGKHEQAGTHCAAAVRLLPGSIRARYLLAHCHVAQERPNAALEVLKGLFTVADAAALTGKLSQDDQTLVRAARALYGKLDARRAGTSHARRYRPRTPEGVAARLESLALKAQGGFEEIRGAAKAVRAGDLAQAEKQLRSLAGAHPTDAHLRAALAEVLALTGRFDDALELLNKKDPYTFDAVVLHCTRARVYQSSGRVDLAVRYLRRAFALEPSDTIKRNLAVLLTYDVDPRPAIPLLQELHRDNPEEVTDAVNLIGAYSMARRHEDAEALALEQVRKRPEIVRFRVALATVYKNMGDAEKALPQLRKVYELDKRHPMVLDLVALLIGAGEYADAASVLDEMLKIESPLAQRSFCLSAMAAAHAGAQAAQGAEETLAMLMETANADVIRGGEQGLPALYLDAAANAYAGLGSLDDLKALPEKARGLKVRAQTVRDLDDFVKHVLDHRGEAVEIGRLRAQFRLLLMTGWSDQAEAKVRAWAVAAPDAEYPRLVLGWLLKAAGKNAEAAGTYRELAEAMPSAMAEARLGEIALLQGKTDEAKRRYEKAVELGVRDAQPYLQLGLMAEKDGKPGDAVKLYEAGTLKAPGSAELHNQLAWLLGRDEKRRAEALKHARKASQLSPEAPAVLDTLGWLHVLAGNYDEAVKHLEKAAEKLPRNARVLYHLGKAQAGAGEPEDAAQTFRNVLLLAPEFEHADEIRRYLRERS